MGDRRRLESECRSTDGQEDLRRILARDADDESREGREGPGRDRDEFDPDPGDMSEEEALDRFIGQMFDGAGRRDEDPVPDCPACGTSYRRFRSSGRLGCPRCYRAFRHHLLPFLGRFHRQVIHLGKFPTGEAGAASRLGEISRARTALEKAIGQEDFEEAARLRDMIRRLESEHDGEDSVG